MNYYFPRTLKGGGLPGSSVVFRQGTNVEIGPMGLAQGGDANVDMDVNSDRDGKGRNITNPMFDAMSASAPSMDTKPSPDMSGASSDSQRGLYEVPLDPPSTLDLSQKQTSSSSPTDPLSLPPMGVSGGLSTTQKPPVVKTPSKLSMLSPSSILSSKPSLGLRSKELSPTSRDTGKDTQSLVTEDDNDNSEC